MNTKLNVSALADAKPLLPANQVFTDTPFAFVEVVLGMPSKQCKGFGICKVDALTETEYKTKTLTPKLRNNKALASIYALTPKTIELHFLKSSMNAATLKTHFNKATFYIYEPVVFKTLKLDTTPNLFRKFELLPDVYSLLDKETCIEITIKIRKV